MTGIERLHDIMVRLRDPETGCPWDRVQTLETLKPCVLEEAYELISAMSHPEDRDNHVEELGDVLLQVMFQCVMAEEKGEFSFDDVANAIGQACAPASPRVWRCRGKGSRSGASELGADKAAGTQEGASPFGP